jgi:DNA-binding CsgD family transcriptional regulator
MNPASSLHVDRIKGPAAPDWCLFVRCNDPCYLDVLNRLTDPILVVDESARLLFANLAARRHFADSRPCGIDSQGYLTFRTPRADRQLLHSLSSFPKRSARSDALQSFTLSLPGELRPWRVLISPLGGGRNSETPPRRFLVHLIQSLYPRNISENLLRRLFNLSPREAQVVTTLNKCGSLPATAAALKISKETARAHLKSIFAKVSVHSQLELILTLQKLFLFEEYAVPRQDTAETVEAVG